MTNLPRRYSPLRQLVLARLREFFREPEALFWVYGFPILIVVALGIAFRNKPVERIAVDIQSSPGDETAVAFVEQALAWDKRYVVHVDDEAGCHLRLRTAKTDVVVIPAESGRGYVYFFDPTRPEGALARSRVDDTLQRAKGREDPLPILPDRDLDEPGSRYVDFLIPGLLGMNLMNAAMWGIGFALVDMRQRKLLKRFVGTPMRRSDFLLALMSSRLLLMLIEVALLLGFGVLVFHMRVLGSLLTILLIGAVGAVAFGGVGLLTASRANKIESVSGLINLVMMPMWIFSGVFFSYERFPAITQPFIKALPLTALNDALRATILQGAPLAAQSGRLLILALWGGISFLLALALFRWT
jgi:ABC-2 type transport system permease protein